MFVAIIFAQAIGGWTIIDAETGRPSHMKACH
jgi:hypothetical protein